MAQNLPIFFDIDLEGITDVKNVPTFNAMRGDIVPAQFDPSGNIINHPTPFYIFCAAKAVNPNNSYQTLPTASVVTPVSYIQFGITQGNTQVFPPTNALGDNAALKNQFTLTNFSKAFTTGAFTEADEESAGLLVPVYCYQSEFTYGGGIDNLFQPSFVFFRADVFYNGDGTDPSLQLPDKPINYQSPNFPTPMGKNKSNFYLLAAFYATGGQTDINLVGSWCQFLTLDTIIKINQDNNYYATGPAASLVSIAFNDPYDGIGTGGINGSPKYYPVNILRSSTIYTVFRMNQYLTFDGTTPGNTKSIQNYWIVSGEDYTEQDFIKRNTGFPLNFMYQLGGDTYSKTLGYDTYYQKGDINPGSNYLGTLVQPYFGGPGGSNGWQIANYTPFYRNNFNFNFNTLTPQGITGLTYKCLCVGDFGGFNSPFINNFCNNFTTPPAYNDGNPNYPGGTATYSNGNAGGIYVTGTQNRTANSWYYGMSCSNIHLGTYNFSMFQFVPINYFNVPRKGAVPPIISPGNSLLEPYTGEVANTGDNGIPATYGPPPEDLPGTNVPIYTPGPVGAGPYSISYPFNGQTGASNNWPTLGEPANRIQNINLTNTLESWMDNPGNFECPRNIGSQNYCGFQDYYHSLLGYFYDKPQDLSPDAECGEDYVPPKDNLITSSIIYTPNGCKDGKICVPNYAYLENIGDPTIKPFYCQDPAEAVPYPESTNGFNTTNSYTIQNFNFGLLTPPWFPFPPAGGRGPLTQPLTYTPITWSNLNTYVNLTPDQAVPAAVQSYEPVGFVPPLNFTNPTTGEVDHKGNSVEYIVIAIIALIILVAAIVFFIYYAAKSKKKDMYNPDNFKFYQRVA